MTIDHFTDELARRVLHNVKRFILRCPAEGGKTQPSPPALIRLTVNVYS